jgi:hypothetical protein
MPQVEAVGCSGIFHVILGVEAFAFIQSVFGERQREGADAERFNYEGYGFHLPFPHAFLAVEAAVQAGTFCAYFLR